VRFAFSVGDGLGLGVETARVNFGRRGLRIQRAWSENGGGLDCLRKGFAGCDCASDNERGRNRGLKPTWGVKSSCCSGGGKRGTGRCGVL
jgi:hypothetical protein